MLIFTKPVGKGRPRFTKSGHVYTDEKTKAFEDMVGWGYKKAIAEGEAEAFMNGEPLRAIIGFYFSIPKSYSKKRKKAIYEGSEALTRRPDIDNLVKSVLDGLNGVAYEDDAQVVEVATYKVYGEEDCVSITFEKSTLNVWEEEDEK